MPTMNTLGLTDNLSAEVLNERQRTIETIRFDGDDLEIGALGVYNFPTNYHIRARVLLYLTLSQPDTILPANELRCDGKRMFPKTIRSSQEFYNGIFVPVLGYNPFTLMEDQPVGPQRLLLLTGVMFDTRLILDEKTGKKIPATVSEETTPQNRLEARNSSWIRAIGESDGILSRLDFRKTDPVITGLLSILHAHTNQELTLDFIRQEFLELAGYEVLDQDEFVAAMERMVAAYKRVPALNNRIFFRTIPQEGKRVGVFSWRTHTVAD